MSSTSMMVRGALLNDIEVFSLGIHNPYANTLSTYITINSQLSLFKYIYPHLVWILVLVNLLVFFVHYVYNLVLYEN